MVLDIPPALRVSQWYLTNLFPADSARLSFRLPHEVEALPDKSADLFVNICSLQEMTHEHVALWFAHIARLCRGHFYMKQYLEHRNDLDHISVNRIDYPVLPGAAVVFDRLCPAFHSLFEVMYRF